MARTHQPADYQNILVDIALVAAAQANDSTAAWSTPDGKYVPGCVRVQWLEQNSDAALKQRVTALASASASSLAKVNAEQLSVLAQRYGVPLSAELAEEIAGYFDNRREAVLTYNK